MNIEEGRVIMQQLNLLSMYHFMGSGQCSITSHTDYF